MVRSGWLFVGVFCVLLPGLSSAHELWIEPEQWSFAQGDPITAQIRNGENFVGSALVWQDRNAARAEMHVGGSSQTITGRAGDRPALQTQAVLEGLGVLLYETTPSKITYKTWGKFQAFVDHKALPVTKGDHIAQGHPEEGFTESYTRHTKAFVQSGVGTGQDRAFGLETELVALRNPFAMSPGQSMPVDLFYQGVKRANAQIEIFERDPDGRVDVRLTQTDAQGRAEIDVKPGHSYLLDAVVLRPSELDGVVYDTLWAALVFHVPE